VNEFNNVPEDETGSVGWDEVVFEPTSPSRMRADTFLMGMGFFVV
jgi:hypothetical protein